MHTTFFVKLSTIFIFLTFPAVAEENSVYDLNGKWDAVYETSINGIVNDTITISQEGSQFVGTREIGSKWIPKGEEAIKGVICDRMICDVAMRCQKNYPVSDELHWSLGRGVITDLGKKMIIQTEMKTITGNYFVTLSLTKK